jgi:hypothetical protein
VEGRKKEAKNQEKETRQKETWDEGKTMSVEERMKQEN